MGRHAARQPCCPPLPIRNSYTGYTVELIVQEGGNLETYGIGPEQF